MAFADGNIIIGTSVDVGGINTGLHKIQKSFRQLGRLAFTTIGVGAFAKLGKAAIDAASDLQEVQNVVDVAFGDMSYKIEEFSKVCIEHFGMSEFAAKQTAGSFMAMATAIGITKQTASDMAVELVGLSGDFASFHNISQKYAEVALSAVFTGETETIKRYGIILTEANLQEYALTQGIEKKVKAMSAAEKTLLRYNYVMERTKMLHGDFERTQENWANSVRVLKEQWQALMVEMGIVFMQKVQPIVNVLNTIIAKLIAIFRYLQELLGITSEIGEATFADEMSDMADAVDEVGGAIKRQLAPFDKLNNLTSKASTGVDDDLSDLEKLYDKAKLSGYVIDAMKNFEIQVTELSDSMKSKLANMVNLFRRAKYKVETIWNNIKLNHWFSAGMNFGDMIASLERFVTESIQGVDWQKKGEEIGEFFQGIIWSDALGGFVDVLISALDGVITMAIAGIKKIDLADIVKMAQNYSKAAKKFFKWLFQVIRRVNWYEFGKKVGKFIAEIDWPGVLGAAAEVICAALGSAINAFGGLIDGLPLAGKLLAGLAVALKIADWTGVLGAFKDSFSKSLKEWKGSSSASSFFKGALGVIELAVGCRIIVDNILDIAAGEIEAGSWEANLNNLIGSLIAAVGASTIVGAFGITLGPAGFVITAGLTFIIGSIVDAIVEPTDDEKLEKAKKDLEDNIAKIDWVHEIDDTIDLLLNLEVNYQTRITNIEGDLDYYEDLAKKWKELSDNYENLTKSDQELVKMFGDEMSTKFPEMKKYIDEVSGAYKGTAENLQTVIDKTRELMMIEALSEGQKETYKALAQAKVEKQNAEKELNDLETQVEKDVHDFAVELQAAWSSSKDAIQLSNYYAFSNQVGGKQQVIKAIEKSLKSGELGLTNKQGNILLNWKDFEKQWSDNELLNNMYDYANASKEVRKRIEKLDKTMEDAYNSIDGYSIAIAEVTDAVRNKDLRIALNDLTELFNGALKGTDTKWEKDVKAAIDAVDAKLKNGEQVTSTDMMLLYLTINNGLAGLPDGALPKDLQTTLDEIQKKLADGKVTYEEAMKLLADAMVVGFNDGLGDPDSKTGLYKVLDIQRQKTIQAIENWKKDIADATKKAVLMGVYENTTQEAEQLYYDSLTPTEKYKYSGAHNTIQKFGFNSLMNTLEKDATKGGKEVQDATVDGITTITPENQTKLTEGGATISGTLVDGIESPLKINSPSKLMRDEVAGSVIEGLVIGLYNGISAIVSAATAVVDALINTFDMVNVSPTMTIVPDVDMANAHIPDIVNGMVIPAQVSGQTSINNTVSGMTKSEFSEVLLNALSNLALGVSLETDSLGLFKEVQNQARIYTNRTHEPAFGG